MLADVEWSAVLVSSSRRRVDSGKSCSGEERSSGGWSSSMVLEADREEKLRKKSVFSSIKGVKKVSRYYLDCCTMLSESAVPSCQTKAATTCPLRFSESITDREETGENFAPAFEQCPYSKRFYAS